MTEQDAIAAPAAAGALTPPGRGADAIMATMRDALFIAILLLGWVSVNPFPDLADPQLTAVGDRGDVVNQIAYLALGGCVAAYLVLHDPKSLRPLARPAYAAMLAWLVISVLTSAHPGLSARRLVFTAVVIVLAAAVLALPTSLTRFVDLVAAVVTFILVLCFAGVLFLPRLSIHQSYDTLEPLLAGGWRGLFAHKNIAGPMMGCFIFIGIYVARARNLIYGLSIATAAAVFLIFSEAKSATALVPVILAISWAAMQVRSVVTRAVIVLSAFVMLNVMTIGSLYLEPIKTFNLQTLPDPTFTGRTEIWQFAIDKVLERPIWGHGFSAFWGTEEVVYATKLDGTGPDGAEHAHNAFLDLAVTTGIPGAILAFIWTVVLPIGDIQRCIVTGADRALTLMFTQIWLIGVYTSNFESVLFSRADPLWLAMLVAMFALRYLSVWRLVR